MAKKTTEQKDKQPDEQNKPDERKKTEPEQPEKQKRAESQEKHEPPLLDEPIQVKDYIYLNILTLEGKAWAYMDLIAHPETQKHQKDMVQAKLAIDTIDALFKIVEEHLTSDQKKDLQTRLTNLRLNFVK
jgi:hypothetical protein